MLRRLFMLLPAVLLAACVNQIAARQAELAQFVGMPETDLIMRMGVPTRSYESGGFKFLAYDESYSEVVPGMPGYPYGPGWGWGWGASPYPSQIVTVKCETTFALTGGVVRNFSLRGNGCG